MDDPWENLRLAAVDALDTLWNDYAKEGKESAVLAPLAQYPNAGAWLAKSLALSDDYVTRKLGAMLAGWVRDPKHLGMLLEMLDHERKVFREDQLSANSVGEDIMFAATRWSESRDSQVGDAGTTVLAEMVRDALSGTHWNTVHWAVANLHHATEGRHAVLREVAAATDAQLEGQQFLGNAVRALRHNDMDTLRRFITAPSELNTLAADTPNYSKISSLWKAAAAAEATLA
jgi:hypothetical protein